MDSLEVFWYLKEFWVFAEPIAVDGSFGPVIGLPIIPVATALLPSGKVLPHMLLPCTESPCLPFCA